jgi:hypothetical protein
MPSSIIFTPFSNPRLVWRQAAKLGLDPGLGVLHKDTPNRYSLACDLMEPIRPKLKFAHLPAIGRTTVSPFLMKSFESLNAGKLHSDQVKPFNFLLTAHVIPFGHPEGVEPEKFHLITPYDSDSRKWLEKEWIDVHSKKRFRITTQGYYGSDKPLGSKCTATL